MSAFVGEVKQKVDFNFLMADRYEENPGNTTYLTGVHAYTSLHEVATKVPYDSGTLEDKKY